MAYNPVRTFEQPSGGFWEWLFGSPERIQQIENFTPQQQQALASLLGQGQRGLGNIAQQYGQLQPLAMQEQSFAPIAQQARTQFATETIPSIAERFTAVGGGQRSSGFQQALGQAGSGLEQGLAALGAQHGLHQQGLNQGAYGLNLQRLQQQQGLYGNLLGAGLAPQFETLGRPATQGAAQNAYSRGEQNLYSILGSLGGGRFFGM